MFIEAKNICFGFGATQIFDNLNFYARKGDSVAIIGQNGCGKSTLLKLLAGRFIPLAGCVTVGGVTAERYRKAVLLPQNYRLACHKTLIENLILPLKLKGYSQKDSIKIANEQLSVFGLKNFADYYPSQLSDGILHRAAIAEVGLFDADLLLLDEPFAGVDKQHLLGLFNYLNAKRLEGVTLIIVTHSDYEAEVLTERSYNLEHNAKAVKTKLYPITER